MDAKGLGRIWASTPASPNVDPGIDKYNKGWVAEIPIFQMLNFINNRYDTNILSLAERGMFQWGNDITYKNGSLAWDELDSYIYVSKVDAPDKSKAPSTNSAQWERSSIQITRAQYDAELAKWNAHIANVSNPHQLTCTILDTYTRAEIDAKIAVPTASINNHISDYNNPHQVTAAQVGAVPITGGTYTGLVNHQNAATGLGAANLNAKFNSDTAGTFLMKGNAKLGLDATSTAVFVDDLGVSSQLLSEADYLNIRESEESSFIAPVPDMTVALRTSINPILGLGGYYFNASAGRGYIAKNGSGATAGLNEPRYSVKGLQIDPAIEDFALYNAGNLNGFDTYTVVLDVVVLKGAADQWLCQLNGNSATIVQGFYQDPNGLHYVYSVGGVQTSRLFLASASIPTTPVKLAVTYDGITLIGYAQGVEVFRVAAAVNNIDGSYFRFYSKDSYYNSLRTWAKALTPRQVSGT